MELYDVFCIGILLVILTLGHKVKYVTENNNRETILSDLEANKLSSYDISEILEQYCEFLTVIIRTYTIYGIRKSEIYILRNTLRDLSNKASKNSLTNEDIDFIKNIFSKKLRYVPWCPILFRKPNFNTSFIWEN